MSVRLGYYPTWLHPSDPYLENGAGGAFSAPSVRVHRQETYMSKTVKGLLALSMVAFIAACAQQEEEFVVVEPEPISSEPEYTGKYK